METFLWATISKNPNFFLNFQNSPQKQPEPNFAS